MKDGFPNFSSLSIHAGIIILFKDDSKETIT